MTSLKATLYRISGATTVAMAPAPDRDAGPVRAGTTQPDTLS